jgi:beta-glucanase (GH16 family)
MLELNTFRDAAWHNRWVTGGLCQCGVAQRYGAYFVRSRITGPGPNEAELLWPAGKEWPPEIDFNETGGSVTSTTTSVHYGSANHIVRSEININMTQWHTWGVIWTPRYIVYTVDGNIWGTFKVPSEISRVPMTLDFEQRQICEEKRQCPTAPQSMQIDWVAEYAPTPTT